MINLNKSYEFFKPEESPTVHIVGCGALGSNVATQIARLGVTDVHLWDFDIVEPVNIANQAFFDKHINMQKTEALAQMMNEINAMCKPEIHKEYTGQKLNGIVFIGVDNIDVRNLIVKENAFNFQCKGFIDVRMRLTDAQMYSAYTQSPKSVQDLQKTMDFTQEEAMAATPVSACGTTLSVIPTVQIVSSYAVANYIRFVMDGKPAYKTMIFDAFNGVMDVFPHK